MASLEVLEKLIQSFADAYIGANNASVALGGFELNLKSVIEVGGRVNQSLVALNRVTGMYGKTVNEMSAQTAALSKQFYVPFEKLLSIQQKLAADLPIAITRQRELVSVLQFAAERFGNTEQGIEAYVGALESLSSKSVLAYQDQMLLIGAADRLRKAQQDGGEAANAATEAYAKQSAITKDNAKIMYISGDISRDEYATIVRTTEALNEQNKARLQTVESVSRASNEFRSAQASMFEVISLSEQFNDFFKVLQVAPGMLAASLTAKMTAKGMEFFDVEHINTQADEVQEVFDAFAVNAEASMKKAASEGKTYEQAITDINKEMEKEGPIQAKAFSAFLEQEDAVKALKSHFVAANKEAMQRATYEEVIKRLVQEGNTEKLQEIKVAMAKAVIQKAEMENQDAMRLLLKGSIDQAKHYNELMQSTVALTESQLGVLSSIRDLGESIGDTSSIQASYSQEIVGAAEREYELLSAASAVRREMAAGARAIAEASGEEQRLAALAMVIKGEKTAQEAQKAALEAMGTAQGEQLQKEAELQTETAKHIRQLYLAGEYNEQAAVAASRIGEAKRAQVSAEEALRKGYSESLRLAVQLGENAEKFASRRVDLARSELELLDSVASGIGASASARAAAAEQGKVVKAMEEQMAAAAQMRSDRDKDFELAKKELELAQARGDQDKTKDAQVKMGLASEAVQTAEQKILEVTSKRNNALKSQLELTKQIREGYLDALSAMSEGAGVFAEIIVDQSKNLGTLLRTAKDMPTSLRTGSNTGSGAGISQFSAGGLDAADWNKDMAEYTNDLVSDQIPEIIKHLSNIANRPTGDMASLNPNRLGAMAEGGETRNGNLGGGSKPAPPGVVPSSVSPAPAVPTPAGSPSLSASAAAPAIEQGFANVQATWGSELGKAVAAAESERAKLVSELSRYSSATGDDVSKLITGMNEKIGATKETGDKQAILGALQNQIAALQEQLTTSQAAATLAKSASQQAANPPSPSAPAAENRAVAAAASQGQPASAEKPAGAPITSATPAPPLTLDMLTSAVQNAHERVIGTVGKDLTSIRESMFGMAPQLEELRKAFSASGKEAETAPAQTTATAGTAVRPMAAEEIIALFSSLAKPAGVDAAVPLLSLNDHASSIRSLLTGVGGSLDDIHSELSSSLAGSGAASPEEGKPLGFGDAAVMASAIVGAIDGQSGILSQISEQMAKMPTFVPESKVPLEASTIEFDTARLASILPSETLQTIIGHLESIHAQLSARESPMVAVDVDMPSLEAQELDISPFVAAIEAMPQMPVDLLSRLVESMVSFAPSVGMMEPPSVTVDAVVPQMPDMRMDTEGIIKSFEAMPQMPADLLEGIRKSLDLLSLSYNELPTPAVSVNVESPESPDVIVDVSEIAESIRSIPVVPLDTMERMAKALEYLSSMSPEVAEPAFSVNVDAPDVPAVNVDISAVAAAFREIPVIPLSLMEGIAKSIDSLSFRESSSAVPVISVNFPPIQVPDVEVDSSGIVDAIRAMPSFPLEAVDSIGRIISSIAASLEGGLRPEVTVDVAAPGAPAVSLDFSPVIDAIRAMPKFPLGILEGTSRSIESMAASQKEQTAPEILVSMPAPKEGGLDVDLSSIIDIISAIPKAPTEVLERMNASVSSLASTLASSAERSIEVVVSKTEPYDVIMDFSPVVDAIASSTLQAGQGVKDLIYALKSSAAFASNAASPTVNIDVVAPETSPPSVDFSGLAVLLGEMPQAPVESVEAIRKSVEALVGLSYAQASMKLSVAGPETASALERFPGAEINMVAPEFDIGEIADSFRVSGMESASVMAEVISVSSSRIEGLLSSLVSGLSGGIVPETPVIQVSVESGQVAGVNTEEVKTEKLANGFSELNSSFSKSADGVAALLSGLSYINTVLLDINSRQPKYSQPSVEVEASPNASGDMLTGQRNIGESIGASLAGAIAENVGGMASSLSNFVVAAGSALASIGGASIQLQESTSSVEPSGAVSAEYPIQNFETISAVIREMQSGVVSGILSLKDVMSPSPAGATVEMATSFGFALEPKVSQLVGGMVDSASTMREALHDGIEGASEVVSGFLSRSIVDFQSAVESLSANIGSIDIPRASSVLEVTAPSSSLDLVNLERSVGDGVANGLVALGEQIRRIGDSIAASVESGGAAGAVEVKVSSAEVSSVKSPLSDLSPIVSALEDYGRSGMDYASSLAEVMREQMGDLMAAMPREQPISPVSVSPIVDVQIPASEAAPSAPGESARQFVYSELLTSTDNGFLGLMESMSRLQSVSITSAGELSLISGLLSKNGFSVNTETNSVMMEPPVFDINLAEVSDGIGTLMDVSAAGFDGLRSDILSLVQTVDGISVPPSFVAEKGAAEPVFDIRFIIPLIDDVSSAVSSLELGESARGATVIALLSRIDENSRSIALRNAGILSEAEKSASAVVAVPAARQEKSDLSPVIISDERLNGELVSSIRSESRAMGNHLQAIQVAIAQSSKIIPNMIQPVQEMSPAEEGTSVYASIIGSLVDIVGSGVFGSLAPMFISRGIETPPSTTTPSAAPAVPAPQPSPTQKSSGEKAVSIDVNPSDKMDAMAVQQAKLFNSIFDLTGLPMVLPPDFFASMQGVAQTAVAKESEAEKKSRVWAQAIQAQDRAQKEKAAKPETSASTLAATPATADALNKLEKATSRLIESGNPVSDKDLEAYRSSMLEVASNYEDFARSMREKASSPINLDRIAEVIATEKNRNSVPAPGSSPASRTAETTASMPAQAVGSISFSMPDNFVRSLSTQVAEMTKSQVVPAIVDGFAQAIRQGFSA